jgi:hypothetical protein
MEQTKEVEVMPPQKTWFFTDSTGRVFPANEKEAFNLLTEKSRWRRQDIKMLGMSDGTTYYEFIKNSKEKTGELSGKIGELKEKLNKYIAGHDKLMFEDFVAETDPRIVRAKKLIKEVEDEMEPLEKQLKDLRENVIKKAFDAELEKARGNMVSPRDFSVIGKTDGDPRNQRFMETFTNSKRVI